MIRNTRTKVALVAAVVALAWIAGDRKPITAAPPTGYGNCQTAACNQMKINVGNGWNTGKERSDDCADFENSACDFNDTTVVTYCDSTPSITCNFIDPAIVQKCKGQCEMVPDRSCTVSFNKCQ